MQGQTLEAAAARRHERAIGKDLAGWADAISDT
jgi:hypothetical protein